ncbi:DNase I-like protein, partial [Agrocybe pediades]
DPANPNSKGVATVVNKQKFKHWTGVNANGIIQGRALLATVPWGEDSSISILNVYAPNDHRENANFWTQIRRHWLDHRLAKSDIVLGDMNFVEDAIDRLPAHPNPTPTLESFNDFKQQLNVTDGWRSRNPFRAAYTYTQASTINGAAPSRSQLDRIYISPTLLTKSQNWESSTTAILTDHKLVSVQVSNPSTPAMGRGRWMIPRRLHRTPFASFFTSSNFHQSEEQSLD